jgi:hypothetical protein
MFGLKFKKLRNLERIGKIFVLPKKKTIQGKLRDRGTVCRFLGMPQNNSDDVYCLLNFKISQVIKSRDLIWLDKDHDSWFSKKQDNESEFGNPIDDEDSDTTTNNIISKETDLNTKLYPSNMKFYKEMKRLKIKFNPEASKVMIRKICSERSLILAPAIALFLRHLPQPHLSKQMSIIKLPEVQWVVNLLQVKLEYACDIFTPRD